jgi:hypothetical protein
MKTLNPLLVLFCLLLCAESSPARAQSEEAIRAADAKAEREWMTSAGLQNYVFGLPLLILERERAIRLDPAALEKARKVAPAAPINQIGHLRKLATADDVLPYTPNNDTVYSGAFVELADEPMILSAPTFSIATGRLKSPTPIPTMSFTSARGRPPAKAARMPSLAPTGAGSSPMASSSIACRPTA